MLRKGRKAEPDDSLRVPSAPTSVPSALNLLLSLLLLPQLDARTVVINDLPTSRGVDIPYVSAGPIDPLYRRLLAGFLPVFIRSLDSVALLINDPDRSS